MGLDNRFVSSLSLEQHPMKNMKPKIKEQYFYVLKYFLEQLDSGEYAKERLNQYKGVLILGEESQIGTEIKSYIKAIVTCPFQPWKKKYRYWLLCDLALILLNAEKTEIAVKNLNIYLNQRHQNGMDQLLEILRIPDSDMADMLFAKSLIEQYWRNIAFCQKKEQRILVTANMSAGKSTLINALAGKKVARTSQEVCTGNNCFIYNKPYEDNQVALQISKLNLDAKEEELQEYGWQNSISMATNFRCSYKQAPRMCLIDTPGVNSSMSRQHRKIAREALTQEKYDILLCILNANKLGTEEELEHIKWISDNILKDKVIFVLNKLDDFRSEDNIQASIEGVKKDLNAIGYENPIVCPISAYFAYLLKKKEYEDILTEDEEDEYLLYSKKFGKQEYDLSPYYGAKSKEDMQIDSLYKSCGIYYLEKILYGGTV